MNIDDVMEWMKLADDDFDSAKMFKMNTTMSKRRLGVPEGRPLADFLPTISIKAKDLAAEMTSINVQTKDLQGRKNNACRA
jgi:DNA-damage-inducible protein D